jgi:glycosyltransferase involved in cell wall biosynthesis
MIITVVLPVYNAGKSLRSALDSALKQVDGVSSKVIVINNASTDETRAILDSYYDPNLSVFHYDEHVDMWTNHNRAFNHIDEGYCLFLHGDDVLRAAVIPDLIKSIANDYDAVNTIYWGYSRFADFSNILHSNGLKVNVGFSGERAFIPFTNQGLTPSGTCYPVERLRENSLFYTNGTTRFASDSISMIRWAQSGLRFKMLDFSVVVRTGATTGAPTSDSARKVYFDALEDILSTSSHVHLRRMANLSLTNKSSSSVMTWFSKYCYTKKLIRRKTYIKYLALSLIRRILLVK